MHSPSTVANALALRSEGLGATRIAGLTGVPVATVQNWLAGKLPKHSRVPRPKGEEVRSCETCGHGAHVFHELPPEYVYLLGLYLGDGCISAHPKQVFRLRVFLDLQHPRIIEDCVAAMRTVLPDNKVHCLNRSGNFIKRNLPSNVEVSSFSKSWPCFFPQHGPGKKHERRIALTDWQIDLVSHSPDQLLRGLIHSDGSRFQNTGRGTWSWPRYSFDNKSSDIRDIFCLGCEYLGVHWTLSKPNTIYVSRKADVARLDEFIGPKA
jgi:hypothetical protein